MNSLVIVNNNMALANNYFVTLRHGVEMPLVGLGTSHQGGFSHEAIMHAFGIGYRFCVAKYSRICLRSNQKVTSPRLVDTAQRYGCEQFLAVAIQESKLKREELFLTDKVFLESIQADRRIIDPRSGQTTTGQVAALSRSPKVVGFWAQTIWICSCCTGQVPVKKR